jgi:hypothetical protein
MESMLRIETTTVFLAKAVPQERQTACMISNGSWVRRQYVNPVSQAAAAAKLEIERRSSRARRVLA